ncbi:hypothetical protein [Vibrio mediterranei]|nr:hypothetical protein [Vibrio mediterranei]
MFNINAPMIRSALFFTLSIVITDMLHLGMPVFSVFLGPALILRDKFSLNKSLVFISLVSIYFISGSLAATILDHNQWALIVISVFVIYSYLRIEKLASFSTAPLFLYCYGLINTTYGTSMELYFYQLLHVAFMMLLLAKAIFWILPTPTNQMSSRQNQKVAKRSKTLNVISTIIISISLVYFLSIEVGKAIFCLSVIISIVCRPDYASIIKGLKSILPLQVSGCFIALVLHMLVAGHGQNILMLSLVIFGFSIVVFYFAHSSEKISKKIPNFEIGLLAATLTPFTLYTHSSGFDIGPFIRRAANMGVIWGVGTLMIVLLPWCLSWFKRM